jgi:hypothetical protein
MKKIIFFITLFFIITACSSLKKMERKCKENPFEELDSLQSTLKEINYKVSIPKKWKSYSKGSIALYLTKKNKDSINYFDFIAHILIYSNKLNNKCKNTQDIEAFLSYRLKHINMFYSKDFKYILLETNHKKYGKGYIIKYKRRLNNKIISYSELILFHNNYGYGFNYFAETEIFQKHLSTFEKVINSFEILE